MTDVQTPVRGRRTRADRIVGVDVARGIALVTMAATHIMSTSDFATGRLTTTGWLFAGRASALFALLAGVSLALVTGGTTPKTGLDRRRARVTITVRALIIGATGLVLAMTGTPVAVILAYYAVLFLVALPVLGLGWRPLAGLAVVWALVSPQVSFWLRGSLPSPPRGQVDVVMVLTDPLTAVHGLLFTGYYPVFTWITYLLAGLAIGRLDLRSTRVAGWLVGLGAVLAAGAWATSALLLTVQGIGVSIAGPNGPIPLRGWELNQIEWYGTTPTSSGLWLQVVGAHSGTTFDLVHTTGSALVVLGLCLLLVRVDLLRKLTYPLAAAGAMTLTLYTVHVMVLSLDLGARDSLPYYLLHVVVALSFAPIWLAFAPKGPFEYVVHSLATWAAEVVVPPTPPDDIPPFPVNAAPSS